MAKTFSEEERIYYIDLVGNYFLTSNEPSLRKCADYLKTKGINISLTTIKAYLYEFVKRNPKKGKDILKIIEKNTAKSVKDTDVKNRVIKVASMFLSGVSMEKISDSLDISADTIYRDLNYRLKAIDESLYNSVKDLLNVHSMSNLNKGNDTYLDQERDSNGRFKK